MDVIWNLTRFCPWACRFCCMNAFYCANASALTSPRAKALKNKELALEEKIAVVRQFAETNFSVDFSGGDPLYFRDDFIVVKEATDLLPPKRISVSITGVEFTKQKINILRKVGMVEFTLDSLPDFRNPWRPSGFHASSVAAMGICVQNGIAVQAVTTLYPLTMSKDNLSRVYEKLCAIGVASWELLRFYPVGRAQKHQYLEPTVEDYLEIMEFVRGFRGNVRVVFQHSLRMLEKSETCMAGNRSLGILPEGQVVACAWALDSCAQPAHEYLVLGRVPDTHIAEIASMAIHREEFRLGAHGHSCTHCGLRSK